MNDVLNRIKDKITEFYKGLSKNKRMMLIGGIVLGITLLTVGLLMVTRPEYVPIAQGLTAVEAQTVTSKLDEMGIAWEDSVNSSVISVKKEDASRARMQIASDMAGANFTWTDVFNSESITMTSETREQMNIQATKSDIESSIMTLDAVENAKVILMIPKDSSYFIKDEIKSKASVVLTLKNNQKLSEEQVRSVVNLVASSVKDLTPENIAILDTSGIQLNNTTENSPNFSANSQYELQFKVQGQLQKELTSFLEKIYGVGNVEVQPKITLDFDQETETQQIFSPPIEGELNGLARSMTTIKENVVNGQPGLGAPGTDSNSGEATNFVEGDSSGSAYEKASETLNYELNEIKRELVKSQGDVQSMTIGILVNSKVLKDETMTEADRAQLVEVVAQSAGTQKENITVMVSSFADPMEMYNVYDTTAATNTLFGIPIFAIVIVVLVTLGVIVALVILGKRKKEKERLAEEQRLMEAEAKIARDKAELDAIETAEEDKGSPKYHIEVFVDKNPEAAATLLRAWLNEN